jgi:protein Hikeshi
MFSVILPGRPCLTDLVTISSNQFAFSFPAQPHFSHVVVFILPGNALPPDTAAAIYMQQPGQSDFKLLGAIGNEKPSAIFKVNISGMQSGNVSLGISVEPMANIQAQLSSLQSENSASMALVKQLPSTKVLAQRIIKNAFNFLASFAGGPVGQEVVPLKSFQDWWTKFERRIENDPGFLERDNIG